MRIEDYDKVEIPKNLNDYIDKGIEKGIDYNKSHKNIVYKRSAAIVAASLIALVTASNVPAFANELVKVPIIGEVVKVLDFTNSVSFGGVITDGNNIVIDSFKKDTINIYFTNNGEFVADTPNYEIEYREYPYTLVFTFSGVRRLDDTKIEKQIESIPYIKDIYKIMVLDDSMYKIAVELDKNVSFKVTEHKDPAMIQIKLNSSKKETSKGGAYFIRTEEFEYGEQMAQIEEMLPNETNKEIQKVENGKYIIQYGPYESEEDAKEKLEALNKEIHIDLQLDIEHRNLGEGPQK